MMNRPIKCRLDDVGYSWKVMKSKPLFEIFLQFPLLKFLAAVTGARNKRKVPRSRSSSRGKIAILILLIAICPTFIQSVGDSLISLYLAN